MNCKHYVGVSCVDGTCPIANSDLYEQSCVPTILDCKDCFYYKGCADCALYGTEYCAAVDNKLSVYRP